MKNQGKPKAKIHLLQAKVDETALKVDEGATGVEKRKMNIGSPENRDSFGRNFSIA